MWIKYLAECWIHSKCMVSDNYSYYCYFMARNFIRVKNLRVTKHPQISNSHLFEQHSCYETLAHWSDLDSLLKLTIMKFGLRQRKSINDLIVKPNGLFSVMFLFISCVACDVVDYSCLNSFIWIPQPCFLLVPLLFQTPSLGLGLWKDFLNSSSVKTSLKFIRQNQHNSANFTQYHVCTCPSSGIEVTGTDEIEGVGTPSAYCIEFFFPPRRLYR